MTSELRMGNPLLRRLKAVTKASEVSFHVTGSLLASLELPNVCLWWRTVGTRVAGRWVCSPEKAGPVRPAGEGSELTSEPDGTHP